MLTVIKFADVNGEPKIKLDLPSPLRLGDPVKLPAFKLERSSDGRREVLEAESRIFRVTSSGYDYTSWPGRQLLSVEAADGRPLTWRSVKKHPEEPRALPPAVFPRTPI